VPRKPLTTVIAVALVAAASLGLSACGSNSSSATTTQAPAAATTAPATTPAPATTAAAPAAGATVSVAADPSGQLAFVQKTLTAPAGKVTFVFTNDAPVPHNFAIKDGVTDGPTDTISGGANAKLTVDLPAGTYEYYCAVPGHEQAGMKGTLTVK
jgi:nitrite reductase (NO-forming)